MLLRMIYDDRLAQAAYLIGCQKSREAIVIDPERDVDRYITIAAKEGLRITAVAETHIHADFVSGSRELAERGARVYVSGRGGDDWAYRWIHHKPAGGCYDHQLLQHNDSFRVGSIEFRALHTPGHTPEHLSYLVTDHGGGATDPMGIVTGDFVFVGDVGRPDLLETAAGHAGSAKPAAEALLKSVREFASLPDYLQVWPAHGAGSACGKALGAVPQSTVGYERRFNPAIKASAEDQRFIDYVLKGQPEPPLYFARMKRINRDGPRILQSVPQPITVPERDLPAIAANSAAIILDARPWSEFRLSHIRGSLNIPLDQFFPAVAGSYIPEDAPVSILAEAAKLDEIARALISVGVDHIAGHIDPALLASPAAKPFLTSTEEIPAAEARERHASGRATMLDVRRRDEFAEGHIPGAIHATHTRLPDAIASIPRDRPLVVNCRGGTRSARATALLEREGFTVANLVGGYMAWESAGLPVER